jgi:glycosyltransferase involved in cell wall biosynthesis
MHEPLITIGITCFNAEDTVDRAVLSAIRQDWPNKEVIVVDDCSSDDSWRNLEALAQRYPITLIRHDQNKGVATARNVLLAAARGEFIAYFDDDDESYPHRLRKQWLRIVEYERQHRFEFVFCTAVRDVAIDGKVDHCSTALGQKAPEPRGEIVADYLLGIDRRKGFSWGIFGTGVLMARVQALKDLGGFDPQFRRREESDIAIRAAFRGGHFIAVDEPLIIQNKTRGEDKGGQIPLKYDLMLLKKHKQYLLKRKVYLGASAMSASRFYWGRGRFWLSWAYTLLACASSPRFAWNGLVRRVAPPR